MPTSPRTPQHSRYPSHISISSPSPAHTSNSRRQSKTSLYSPITPNDFDRSNPLDMNGFGSGGKVAQGHGLGNLADELADAWSDGEGGDVDEGDEMEGVMEIQNNNMEEEGIRDSGVDVTSQQGNPVHKLKKDTMMAGHGDLRLGPETLQSNGRGHRRALSEYDGSDYGEDSDLESSGLLPPALVARMDTVEALARRGAEENGGQGDGVVGRVVEGLRDLGGQSGVEAGATRFAS